MKDRIEANQYSSLKRIGLTLVVLSIMRLLILSHESGISGLGRNVDILIIIGLGILFLYGWLGNKLNKRTRQFIEWNDNSVTYKLGEEPINTISYESISSINIGQNEINITLENHDNLKLDIWDFKKYNIRQRIRKNFEQIKN